MYFWKIKDLSTELIEEGLSQTESFKYLMANTILYSLCTIQYGNVNEWDNYSVAASIIIAVLGLWFIYKCNGGPNGKDILERYISIGWVLFVRLIVIFLIPAALITFTVQEMYFGGVPDESTAIDFVFIQLFEIIYILLMAKHINHIAKKSHA